VRILPPAGRAWTWSGTVLVAGVLVSLVAAAAAARVERRDAAESLDRRTAAAQRAVAAEVRRYESTVAQLAASIGAQRDLSASDFAMITAPLADSGYAGAVAAAFVVPVADSDVPAAQARWRAQGATDLTLRPVGTGQHYFSVFATSLDGTGVTPGGDLAAAPEPVAAVAEAQRANRVTVSDTYVLLRDRRANPTSQGMSFVMAAPVYSPGGRYTGGAAGFRGWLVMALRARGLADATLVDAAQGLVNVRLSAATAAGGETVAVDVRSGEPSWYDAVRAVRVPVAQQHWTLTVQSTRHADRLEPGFVHLASFLGAGGSAFSLLLAVLVWVLLTARGRALRDVRTATSDLREQQAWQERLLATLSRMGEGVAVLESERLVFANEAFAAITGYPPHELPALDSLGALLADEGERRAVARVREAARLGEGVAEPFRTRIRHRDGHVVPIEATSLRTRHRQSTQEVLVVRDLTEQLRVQDELAARAGDLEAMNAALEQARDEAAAASRAKTDFLTTMSHEIRTPLNGVLGLTAMLLDTDLDDEQRDLVQTATRSGESLLAIINDILDFSKIEAGKVTLENRTVELRPMLHDVADTFAVQAAAKDLDLVVDVAAACPEALETDPTRLRQILLNLVGNAVKFTETGHVLIAAQVAAQVADPAADPGVAGELRLSVTDTGEGISETAQRRLFAAFEQADVTTTRRFGGTGLGLSISGHLAELLGGRITVRSTPAKGSTFTVTLPLPQGAAPSAPSARDGAGPLEGRTVLLACRTAALRSHLARRLRAWGAEVVAPPEPWPLPEPGQVDAAVVDARGADAPYGDRLIALAARTPVVLLTQPGRPVSAGAPGCVEVPVPVRPERLQAALRSLLADGAAPVGVTAGAAAGPAAGNGASGGGFEGVATRALRVLVAEDNPVNQRIAAAMLEKLGHSVDVVGTGREAVDAAQLAGYDVVLMDCQMPEMDGWEATATLRSIPATRTLPVIALTASATTDIREACLRAGMDGYLSKPVRVDELRAAIDTVTAARPVHH
jgi:PAS domain S-box-containing protein